MNESDDRLTAARRMLEREGIEGTVSVAGIDGEIAAVQGPPHLRDRLAALAPDIRSLGFRYVALEPALQNHDDEDS